MYQYGSLLVELPRGWIEITDEVPATDPPLTFANESGGGALQFSIDLVLSGVLPNPTLLDLQRLLEERSIRHSWGAPISLKTGSGSLMYASGEYRTGEQYLRAWYLSDGRNLAFATFICDWDGRSRQRQDVDAIIRTLEFAEEDPEIEG